MMFSSTTCRFVACFLSLSLSATAETVRGVHRELEATVDLGAASGYAILTKTGITTTGTTAITGNIAVSPIKAAAMTGFAFTAGDAKGTFSNSMYVTGKAYASDYKGNIPELLTTAVGAMETAYTDAAGRPNTNAARINLGAGILGGAFGGATAPLTAGVYTFGTAISLTDDIHLKGSATDIFIIQVSGNMIVDAGVKVILDTHDVDGENETPIPQNIFWQVSGFVDLFAGAHVEGVILSKTAVIFKGGSSLNGRVLSQTACTMVSTTIVDPY
jgi:hypothetical protein